MQCNDVQNYNYILITDVFPLSLMKTNVLTSTKHVPGMHSQVVRSFTERPVVSSHPHWSPVAVNQPAGRDPGPGGLVVFLFCLLCDWRMWV